MTPVIRPARRADLPAILALYGQPAVDAGDVLALDEAEAIWERFGQYPDYTLYVAEHDGRVAGTLTLMIIDNLGHRGAPSGLVEAVAVDPDLQGQGIGKAMMHAAAARCRERGCYKLALSAASSREPAHRFYESLGLRRHGYSFLLEL